MSAEASTRVVVIEPLVVSSGPEAVETTLANSSGGRSMIAGAVVALRQVASVVPVTLQSIVTQNVSSGRQPVSA